MNKIIRLSLVILSLCLSSNQAFAGITGSVDTASPSGIVAAGNITLDSTGHVTTTAGTYQLILATCCLDANGSTESGIYNSSNIIGPNSTKSYDLQLTYNVPTGDHTARGKLSALSMNSYTSTYFADKDSGFTAQ